MGRSSRQKYLVLFQVAVLFLHEVIRVQCNEPNPRIQTEKGSVQGFTRFFNGKKVDIFYGIPYAKPPVGNLRYKLPVPPDAFEGVWNATVLPNSCMQALDDSQPNFLGSEMWNANTPTSEDCLYLNVWVPRTTPPYSEKPVIVWIYGGSFNSGTSTLDIYQAHYLAAENDIIVVSIQYRMGSFGFLSLNTAEAPGNAGLYDQHMALQWVSNNIHHFGGSSSKVTIMGESSGAVSVGLLLLCPICRDKFQRAIMQSGSPQAKWGAVTKQEMVNRSMNLSKNVGCYKADDHDYVVECLRGKNASIFPGIEYKSTSGIIQFAFVPIIDGILVPHDPEHLLDMGTFPRIPILLGSDENEATYFFSYELDFKRNTPSVKVHEYYYYINKLFEYYPRFSNRANKIVKESIAHYYRNWLRPDDEWELLRSLDRAVSDCYFVCAVNYIARSFARYSAPVYYYWFNHRWSANPWAAWMGVLHADELWFVFGHPLNGSLLTNFTNEERQLSRDIMRYWGNFAKTGNPNEPGKMQWPQFKENEQAYMNFTLSSTPGEYYIGNGPRVQECAFWDNYLPALSTQTMNITDAEAEWKLQFDEWKTKYIVEWKTQFDHFLQNYQRRTGTCSGGKP